MPANLSLILNVLLLIGVIMAIAKIVTGRRASTVNPSISTPSLDNTKTYKSADDIIAVRKISPDFDDNVDLLNLTDEPVLKTAVEPTVNLDEPHLTRSDANSLDHSLVILLTAKENRQLAGYELLQTLLGAGLRFGEGQLFHRHQHANGQGPVLCSLAAATPTGQFDLHNIGSFATKGLCLFMQASGNSTIDEERFSIMLETAQQLNDDLGTQLLDDQQRPLNDQSLERYYRQLNIHPMNIGA